MESRTHLVRTAREESLRNELADGRVRARAVQGVPSLDAPAGLVRPAAEQKALERTGAFQTAPKPRVKPAAELKPLIGSPKSLTGVSLKFALRGLAL
jgi:hypothetical protein